MFINILNIMKIYILKLILNNNIKETNNLSYNHREEDK